jgi:hypothetical protein
MTTCPECGSEITELAWESTTHPTGTLKLDKKGNERWFQDDLDFFAEPDYVFWCQNCNSELFRDTDDAISFLKQGIVITNIPDQVQAVSDFQKEHKGGKQKHG